MGGVGPRPSRFNPEVDPVRRVFEQGGTTLDIGTMPDGQPIARAAGVLEGLQPFEVASISEGNDTADIGPAVAAPLVIMGSGAGALLTFALSRISHIVAIAEVMGRYSGSSGQFGHFEVFLTLDGLLAADTIGRSAHYLPVNAASDGLDLGWSGTPHGFNFKQSSGRTLAADAALAAGAHDLRLLWQTRTGHVGSAFCRHYNIRVFAVPEDWSVEL